MDIEEDYELESNIRASPGQSYDIVRNGSNSFSLVYETSGCCSICYARFSTLLSCSCNLQYCEGCLKDYFLEKIAAFECYNARCPGQTCTKSSSKLAKTVLAPKDYKNFRKFSKKIKCLADPSLKFCVRPDCSGVGQTGKKHFFCNKCKCEFMDTVDPGRLEILEKMNVVECPDCNLLISTSFGCLTTTCLCGLEFCVKCKKTLFDGHSEWKCALNTRSDRISWVFLLILLYFPIIFPFSPALFILGYYWNWDRNYFPIVKSSPGLSFFLLFLLSPFIFLLGLFLFPVYLAWLCMDSLFDERSSYYEGRWLFVLKALFFSPSILPIFIGFLLLTALVISFGPLVGFVLLIGKLVSPKSF